MKRLLEICIDSVSSGVTAQEAGADRVELCDNLAEGGTTPSAGRIRLARSKLTIPIYVLIRPRGGDFLYTDLEYEEMKRDIETAGELGAEGVVLGVLLADGNIDFRRTSELVRTAKPMDVTFHRAFDMTPDPFLSLEEIIGCGAKRILTSGHAPRASQGAELIRSLVKKATERIIIMPGGGIDEYNIGNLASLTGASEFHLSARKIRESLMIYRKKEISMGEEGRSEYDIKMADGEKIARIRRILDR